ncbi:DNA polymerase ligase-domain-containing protein [Aspergillus avenaceus]|uniref:DNA polymerase ligase-domain-containing protein n=1 Tax=Aspergillus avenaceus TaxID=36643 RepID=A0A5N6U297_ASPAV|nr:DNA polymerase ligase-domain-containing protein [Aspergillus avenaceus]
MPDEKGKRRISTLDAPVSPPQKRSSTKPASSPENQSSTLHIHLKTTSSPDSHSLAEIEAGRIEVTDHLSIFAARLNQALRPGIPQSPRLNIPDWIGLYQRNQHPDGRHFVIHQHDHPIAGPHYDLRLQFSESSSVSWSIMYGLPGNPNSRRITRNAIETRVHCLWNHLIETASPVTGSMIIWDTGEYEVLPYQIEQPDTDDSHSETSSEKSSTLYEKESEKLCQAFQNRKIRLRLHGTRLPENYTFSLRLDKITDVRRPSTVPRKRRRRAMKRNPSTSSSDISPDSNSNATPISGHESSSVPDNHGGEHSDAEGDVDEQIRINNAYPGSTNLIGSIHQRRWFATLDRVNSGFVGEPGSGPARKNWVRRWDPKAEKMLGFEPFFVHGPDAERSVVTGRLGRDVLMDERVKGFVSRKGWRPVLE